MLKTLRRLEEIYDALNNYLEVEYRISGKQYPRSKCVLGKHPFDKSTSLCQFILEEYPRCEAVSWVSERMTEWEGFSGNCIFPVPSSQYKASEAFFTLNSNLWVGEYGRSRKELLEFLIVELDKEIEKRSCLKGRISSIINVLKFWRKR